MEGDEGRMEALLQPRLAQQPAAQVDADSRHLSARGERRRVLLEAACH